MRKKTKGGENTFGEEEGGQEKKEKRRQDLSERRGGLGVWVGDQALIRDMANRAATVVGLSRRCDAGR